MDIICYIYCIVIEDLNEIKWEYRRCQVENMLKMMQIVVDSPKEDAGFKWR